MQKNNLNQIQKLTQKIVKEFQPEKVILFGSQAWGKPEENSDVDLFIIKETDDTRKLAVKIDSFLFPRPFPIDLIVYKPTQVEKRKKLGDFFITNILNKGKILYDRQN